MVGAYDNFTGWSGFVAVSATNNTIVTLNSYTQLLHATLTHSSYTQLLHTALTDNNRSYPMVSSAIRGNYVSQSTKFQETNLNGRLGHSG